MSRCPTCGGSGCYSWWNMPEEEATMPLPNRVPKIGEMVYGETTRDNGSKKIVFGVVIGHSGSGYLCLTSGGRWCWISKGPHVVEPEEQGVEAVATARLIRAVILTADTFERENKK